MSSLTSDLERMYAMQQQRAEEKRIKEQAKSCGLRAQDELRECIAKWQPHVRDNPNVPRNCQEAHGNRLALCLIELETEVAKLNKS